MHKFLIFILLLSSACFAQEDQTIISGGIGVFNSGKNTLSETKMLTVSEQEELWGALKDRVTLGGWLDNAGNGKSSSALASGQVGWEVNNKGTVFGVFTGPAVISNTDVLLGGHFQFMDEIHFGLQDTDENYMGIMYRHLSSAGLASPNIGRDVIGVEMRF